MRTVLFILFYVFAIAGYSQRTIDVEKPDYKSTYNLFYTVGGTPLSLAKYVRVVSGSRYFSESFMKGKVVLNKGSVYDSIYLRLDLMDNTLQYIDPDGREMTTALTLIKNIILYDSVTRRQYEFDNSVFLPATNTIEYGLYQLLTDGRAALYKRVVKTLIENKPYGSATVEQTISNRTEYYLFVNSFFTRIKKLKDILEKLNDKKEELNIYISNKK